PVPGISIEALMVLSRRQIHHGATNRQASASISTAAAPAIMKATCPFARSLRKKNENCSSLGLPDTDSSIRNSSRRRGYGGLFFGISQASPRIIPHDRGTKMSASVFRPVTGACVEAGQNRGGVTGVSGCSPLSAPAALAKNSYSPLVFLDCSCY